MNLTSPTSVPFKLWVEALSTTVFLIKRLSSMIINLDSPFFRIFKTQRDYNNLHTFWCVLCTPTFV